MSVARFTRLQRSAFNQRTLGLIRCHSYHFSSVEAKEADGRARLSRLWAPAGGIAAASDEDAHSKLIRAGFLRQAHTGIFHFLPLGRRVQEKLEALIDKHMYGLGASKVALSSISSEELWKKSGRLDSAGSELFRVKDRKETPYLLSPTHEEEITSLVSATVHSYKQLPIRLYQISRKYRDELRPRHGLLRSREFVMKDLYTFDYSSKLALETYHQVRAAYSRLFDELKLPYLVAEADSGSIGGDLSHEFHFPTSKGEDHVIKCTKCSYVANEELAVGKIPANAILPHDSTPRVTGEGALDESGPRFQVWRGISRDRLTLVNVWYPLPAVGFEGSDMSPSEINIYAIKSIIPEIDSSIDNTLPFWDATTLVQPPALAPRKLINLIDGRLTPNDVAQIKSAEMHSEMWPLQSRPFVNLERATIFQGPVTGQAMNLLRIKDGDFCPRCAEGTLKVQKAIELGHTFHLGTRYSQPMMATIAIPAEIINEEAKDSDTVGIISSEQQVSMQMGCHGIGVSRIIGAVADTLADDKGLNWPRVMAPFEAIIVPSKPTVDGVLEIYDELSLTKHKHGSFVDVVLDDRKESFAWKMRDADLVGYPVIVIVGRRWKEERICEVQCRRLKVRTEVPIGELWTFVNSLLVQL